MDAYDKAIALGLVGDDETIVAALKSITMAPISLSDLMELLNFRGMLRKTDGAAGQERWKGTLQNLKAALVALEMTSFVDAYELWFSHVTNPRQSSWDTTNPEWAKDFLSMEVNFAGGDTMPTVADFAAVVALGGGRPYSALTVADIVAQRAASDEAAAQAAAQAIIDAEAAVVKAAQDRLVSYTNEAASAGAAFIRTTESPTVADIRTAMLAKFDEVSGI